jgi:glycosyltransferase involved in cell wall biosynthesis
VRIGLYVPVFDQRPAGVGVYVDAVCSRLVEKNPDCVLITQTPENRPGWASRLPMVRVPRASLAPERVAGPARRAARLLWLASAAHLELLRHGVDVLFSPVQEGQTFGRTPQVVVMHDLTALRVPEAYARGHVEETRLWLPLVLRHCAKVVAISESTKRDVAELFGLDGAMVQVVGEGFDREVFQPAPPAEQKRVRQTYRLPERYLLYAGTYSRHKNLKLLPRMLNALEGAEDVGLVLVGRRDAGMAAELDAEVAAQGLSARVINAGYVPREDLAPLMSGAAAFVFPSRYEGFGLAVLEALACGAPVVCSAVASLPEVVGEAGWLVKTEEPTDWARAVGEALRSERSAVAKKAQAQAARFDWDGAVDALLETMNRAARA